MSSNFLFILGILAFYIIGIRGNQKAPSTDNKSTVHTVENSKGDKVEMGGGGRKFGEDSTTSKDTSDSLPIDNYYNQLKRYK